MKYAEIISCLTKDLEQGVIPGGENERGDYVINVCRIQDDGTKTWEYEELVKVAKEMMFHKDLQKEYLIKSNEKRQTLGLALLDEHGAEVS